MDEGTRLILNVGTCLKLSLLVLNTEISIFDQAHLLRLYWLATRISTAWWCVFTGMYICVWTAFYDSTSVVLTGSRHHSRSFAGYNIYIQLDFRKTVCGSLRYHAHTRQSGAFDKAEVQGAVDNWSKPSPGSFTTQLTAPTNMLFSKLLCRILV